MSVQNRHYESRRGSVKYMQRLAVRRATFLILLFCIAWSFAGKVKVARAGPEQVEKGPQAGTPNDVANGFPVLMTNYKYDHLSNEQRRIYLYAFFEALSFVLYGMSQEGDVRILNAWSNCVAKTKDSGLWSSF